MHDRVSVVAPQAVPPQEAGVVIDRVRVCVPVPQATLHVLHDDQVVITQFTARQVRREEDIGDGVGR